MDGQLLALFGVTMEQLVFVSGSVYLLTELLKTKFIVIKGLWVDLLSVTLAGLISWKLCPGEPTQIIILTAAAYLLPAGFHKARKAKL